MELEKLAASGAEMPDNLGLPEQLLFLTLRELYNNYKSGAVNRERGQREKKRIMLAYNGLKTDFAIVDYHMKLRRRLEHEVGTLYKCDCEHCRKFVRVLDGIERKDIPEDIAEVNAWNERLRELVKERSERAAELATIIDRVRWIIEAEVDYEEQVKKIKEVVKKEKLTK